MHPTQSGFPKESFYVVRQVGRKRRDSNVAGDNCAGWFLIVVVLGKFILAIHGF